MVRHPVHPAPVDRFFLASIDSRAISKYLELRIGLRTDRLVTEGTLLYRRYSGVRLARYCSVAERAVQSEFREIGVASQLVCSRVDRVREVNRLVESLVESQNRNRLAKPTRHRPLARPLARPD